ncbi:MAG: hypothetical protein ACI9LA_001196, partial [Bacteroidia bacterium]
SLARTQFMKDLISRVLMKAITIWLKLISIENGIEASIAFIALSRWVSFS